jgi:hypothetical protein
VIQIHVGQLVRFVVETHQGICSYCRDVGWNKSIWLNVRWVSGADPPGAPALVLCDECWELANVGPLVR